MYICWLCGSVGFTPPAPWGRGTFIIGMITSASVSPSTRAASSTTIIWTISSRLCGDGASSGTSPPYCFRIVSTPSSILSKLGTVLLVLLCWLHSKLHYTQHNDHGPQVFTVSRRGHAHRCLSNSFTIFFTSFVIRKGGIVERLPPVARCPRELAVSDKICRTDWFLKIISM